MPRFGSFLLAGEQRDKITLTHRSTPAYNPIYGQVLKLSSVSSCSWANFIIRFPKQISYSVTRTCTLPVGFAQPHGHVYFAFKPHHPILNGPIVGNPSLIRLRKAGPSSDRNCRKDPSDVCARFFQRRVARHLRRIIRTAARPWDPHWWRGARECSRPPTRQAPVQRQCR